MFPVCFMMIKKKIQIRINGQAKIEKSYQPSWDKLTIGQEDVISAINKPGTEVSKPSSGFLKSL